MERIVIDEVEDSVTEGDVMSVRLPCTVYEWGWDEPLRGCEVRQCGCGLLIRFPQPIQYRR